MTRPRCVVCQRRLWPRWCGIQAGQAIDVWWHCSACQVGTSMDVGEKLRRIFLAGWTLAEIEAMGYESATIHTALREGLRPGKKR